MSLLDKGSRFTPTLTTPLPSSDFTSDFTSLLM
jgi:hypothetical protein